MVQCSPFSDSGVRGSKAFTPPAWSSGMRLSDLHLDVSSLQGQHVRPPCMLHSAPPTCRSQPPLCYFCCKVQSGNVSLPLPSIQEIQKALIILKKRKRKKKLLMFKWKIVQSLSKKSSRKREGSTRERVHLCQEIQFVRTKQVFFLVKSTQLSGRVAIPP